MAKTITQKLAEQFRTTIQEWLTEEELAEVDRKNATPQYEGCCATHDYCDANEAMHRGMEW